MGLNQYSIKVHLEKLQILGDKTKYLKKKKNETQHWSKTLQRKLKDIYKNLLSNLRHAVKEMLRGKLTDLYISIKKEKSMT